MSSSGLLWMYCHNGDSCIDATSWLVWQYIHKSPEDDTPQSFARTSPVRNSTGRPFNKKCRPVSDPLIPLHPLNYVIDAAKLIY